MFRNELIGVALDQNGYYKDIADMLKKVSLRLKRKNRVKNGVEFQPPQRQHSTALVSAHTIHS